MVGKSIIHTCKFKNADRRKTLRRIFEEKNIIQFFFSFFVNKYYLVRREIINYDCFKGMKPRCFTSWTQVTSLSLAPSQTKKKNISAMNFLLFLCGYISEMKTILDIHLQRIQKIEFVDPDDNVYYHSSGRFFLLNLFCCD